MATWIIPPNGLIDTGSAQEFTIDGIGAIEMMDGSIRSHLYAEYMPLESAPDSAQRIVAVKIRWPMAVTPAIIAQLAQCLWRPPAQERVARGKPHLV